MFSKRSAGKPVLIADIGDASLAVSLARLAPHTAEILLSIRATLPIEERTKEQTIAAITKLLEETVAKVLAAPMPDGGSPIPPHEIYAVMRAPWTRFRTAKTEEIFPESRVITAEIIAAEGKNALDAPAELDAASILEAGVLQVFLNGYPTDSPVGKRAQSIGVVAYQSDLDGSIATSVRSAFGKIVPGRTPTFYSGMRALLAVMHEYLPDAHRFLLIDVGGSSSSCAVVRKDAVTQYAAVPEGLSSILRRINQGGLPEESLSLLRMLSTDACSTAACQSIKDALANAEPELVRAFGEVFASLAAVRRLPNACMLSAPMELSLWLQGFFERIDFSQFTATTQPLAVETLTPEHLLNSVHWNVGVVPDTGIGLTASAVHILERKH